MKIEDIIKKAISETKLISEQETPRLGQETKSVDLTDPESVLDAALRYNCSEEWGVGNVKDVTAPVDMKFTYRGKEFQIPKGRRYLTTGPIEGGEFVFLGRQIPEESTNDNTFFYGFNKTDKNGFRWLCSSLKTVQQAGTDTLTPAQKERLDAFLSTDGSVYTKVGGAGLEAKEVSELKFRSGKPVFDQNTGIPRKGNFVYIQTGLENKDINQILAVQQYLEGQGWTLTVPDITTPAYGKGRRVIDMVPDIKKYGLTGQEMVYPTGKATTPTVSKTSMSGKKEKADRQTCTPAINFLFKCFNSKGVGEGCDDLAKINNSKLVAAKCYQVSRTQKGTKFAKGMFGPEDELMTLVRDRGRFGIQQELQQMERNIDINESVKLSETIKSHLLENIRMKNSKI